VATGAAPCRCNDYSIPHTLVTKPLTLVASDCVVRLLDGTREVARHTRCWDKGKRLECKGGQGRSVPHEGARTPPPAPRTALLEGMSGVRGG
jgi:hypothetical protein